MKESKEENKGTNKTEVDSQIQRTKSGLSDESRDGALGEKGKGVKRYKLTVTT